MYTSEGAADLLITNRLHPEEEIEPVTTPKGFTIESLNPSLLQGMVASFNKIITIKKNRYEFI
jgi:pyrroline-5-carboxylate reductase